MQYRKKVKMDTKKVASKVVDSSDGWKVIRDYILSRMLKRYSTMEDLKNDANKKYEQIMKDVQANYTRFFDNELTQSLDVFGIEILGEDTVSDLGDTGGDIVDDTHDPNAPDEGMQKDVPIDNSMLQNEPDPYESPEQKQGRDQMDDKFFDR